MRWRLLPKLFKEFCQIRLVADVYVAGKRHAEFNLSSLGFAPNRWAGKKREDGMARPLRIQKSGAWYHVTARGNERRPIYRDQRDRKHFCELLAELVERYRWLLHAYVGLEPAPAWLSCQSVRELLGGRPGTQQRRAYREHVESAVRQGLPESPWGKVIARVMLGGKEFGRGAAGNRMICGAL